jgi:hypothetical protein
MYAFDAIRAKLNTVSLSVTFGPCNSSTVQSPAASCTALPSICPHSSMPSIVSLLLSTSLSILKTSAFARNGGTRSRFECSSSAIHTAAPSGISNRLWRFGYWYAPWWNTCLSENSLRASSWVFGGASGGGRAGSSSALETARNDRRSDAVTRVGEMQGGRLGILKFTTNSQGGRELQRQPSKAVMLLMRACGQ